QLCPQLPEMYLFVVTLGKTTLDNEVAINLPLLVDLIIKELELDGSENIERFNDLLHMIGYIDSDRYRDYSYILINQKMYQITVNFPRICANDINAGIDRVTYYIDLALCEPFKNCPEWMEV
ncbi:MAG: PD-(D/E)XK motif protein, partial [Deltaproteobacteria bacterium]|nr:PD-(D/E)XK motif protein [Deltaproteobacteria bacterium]